MVAFIDVGGRTSVLRTRILVKKILSERVPADRLQLQPRGSRSVRGVPCSAHLDNAAFIAALNALASADLLRLRKKSAYRAMGTGMEGDDLLNEAIKRTLEEGGRKCPADVPVAVYLDNVMRSIADGEREKYSYRTPVGDGHDENSPVGRLADGNPTPADAALNRIELERVVVRIQDIFANDPQAQAVVIGDMEGWSPKEIREIEPMDDNEYVAARKRVRRTLEREFGGRDRT